MKKIKFIAIIAILAIASCNMSNTQNMDDKQVENKYSTPEAALNYAKANLHMILNESQMRSYGLTSEEQIKKLVTTNDVPLILFPMDKLNDTIINPVADGKIFALGEGRQPMICITVRNPDNKNWIISTIGLKKYVNALANQQDVSAIVEVAGLEISLLEVQTATEKFYTPIVDYSEANLYRGQNYKLAETLRSLEAYRAELEKKFGKEFSSGLLER